MSQPLIYNTGHYFKYLLDYYKVKYVDSHGQLTFKNYDQYNQLVSINRIFSNNPSGDIVDRTGTTPMPFKKTIVRPWRLPTTCLSLDQVFESRVRQLESLADRINIMWSGGIDSTTIMTAVLKHGNLKKYRVLYTPVSILEYPAFYLMLAEFQNLELVDISQDAYLIESLDGIFVTGAGGDGLTASLDESFVKQVGYAGLQAPWQEYFRKKTADLNFLNFCEEFFDQSGKNISTLLQARWWFYTRCKLQKFPSAASELLSDNQPLALGFFDCREFENYMFFNQDNIITNSQYSSYKNQLKDYIFSYYPDQQYRKNKIKLTSTQIHANTLKKNSLNFRGYIMLLDNGKRVRTPNLPFFNSNEFNRIYQNQYDYLFAQAPY